MHCMEYADNSLWKDKYKLMMPKPLYKYEAQIYHALFFSISVDKTEALHKQSSLQVASAGTSSVSSSIGISSASSSSLISPPTKFYSYLMSFLFSYAARLATTSGRQYVHHTSSIVSLIMFVLISFSCVSFPSQLSFLSYSRAQENDMTSQAISNIQKKLR